MIRRGLKELVFAPAFFVWAVLFADSLQAQSAPASAATPARVQAAAPGGTAFEVDIAAPREIEDFLRRHLELMRYRELADLDNAELQRLLPAAERNTRELLATLGYFSPEVAVQLVGPPDAGAAPRRVSIAVQPGPATRVAAVAITFGGAITDATDAPTVRQRDMIRANWSLPPGTRFTQAAWDDAKNAAVRQLGAQRYALGQIAASLADIDPQEHTARLSLTLLLLMIMSCSVFAGTLSGYAHAAAAQLFSRQSYVGAVLGARPVAPAIDIRREMRERRARQP